MFHLVYHHGGISAPDKSTYRKRIREHARCQPKIANQEFTAPKPLTNRLINQPPRSSLKTGPKPMPTQAPIQIGASEAKARPS